MIFFLASLSLANPLSVQTDLHTDYVHRESIVIHFNLHNTSAEAITIPDLSKQTWRTSFSIKHPTGHTDTRRSAPKKGEEKWTLQPREQRQVRLEVPSSAGLKVGSYTLGIKIDYELGVYDHNEAIEIVPQNPIFADILTAADQQMHTIWLQKGKTRQHVYYDQTPVDQYLGSTSAQRIHKILQRNTQPHYYWTEGSTLNIQSEKRRKLSLAWPNAKPVARLSKDGSHYYLPIWVPRTKNGDLYVMQINPKGLPSFRKVHMDMPTPMGADALISTTNEVFFLVYTNEGVEFFRAAPSDQPNFPINSKFVLKASEDQKIQHALFQLHPEHGVAIFVTYTEQEKQWYRWFSIRGTPLDEPKLASLPPFMEIIDASASPLSWIVRNQDKVLFCTAEIQQTLPSSMAYAIGKEGPMIFANGNLQPVPSQLKK